MDDNWRWLLPNNFYYLVLIPILFVLAIFFLKKSLDKVQKNFGKKMTPFLTSSYDDKKAKYRIGLELLVLTLIIVAWARPQAFGGKQKIKKAGVEILMLIDVSNSMSAEDVKPNRLNVAKAELSRFVDLNPNHRYSIVAFAGSAALLSPLTTDPEATKMYLESLDTKSVSEQGTNIQKALKIAKEAFERGGEASSADDRRVTRILLLVSDGEDHDSAALDVVKELNKEGYRLFAMSVGTDKGTPIPIYDDQGQLRGYRLFKGETIMSKVNFDFLKDIAKAGDGSFSELKIGGAAVQNISNEINELDQSEFGDGEVAIYSEKFQIFLVFALILGLIEFILGNRKAKGRIWQGRFEVMKS